MKTKVTMIITTLVLVGNMALAGLFTDDFNRANTSATSASTIGSTWEAGASGGSSTDDWAIWNSRLQFKGADEWAPANFMYNTDAITDLGDFTMQLDLVPNHPQPFSLAIGAVWNMGDLDGAGGVNDGFGIRFGDNSYQVVRMSDGVIDAQVAAGSLSSAMQQGVSYTLTVTATAFLSWDISLNRASDSLSLMSASATGGAYPDWGLTTTYGGVMYNSSVWESSVDNFSVSSPSAIPEPTTMVLLGLASGAVFGIRRLSSC